MLEILIMIVKNSFLLPLILYKQTVYKNGSDKSNKALKYINSLRASWLY